MKFDKHNIKSIFFTLMVYIAIVFISHQFLNIRTTALVDEKYLSVANDIQTTTQSYIDAKRETIIFIALSLANDKSFAASVMSSRSADLLLDEFSETLRLNTMYKNVWIQISNNKGISLYRSWTDKRGDDISKVRKDIVQMIKDPKVTSTISTGIFDMTFKSMVPIYKDNRFIGTIEVISKFNSIAEQLLNKGYEPLFLVDKSYKEQIKKPFTKMFIDDYYIANLNASKSNQNYIQDYGIEKIILNTNDYIIDKKSNKFITKYIQKDINGNDMGYLIMLQALDSIDLSHIYFYHNAILLLISLLLIGVYLIIQLLSSVHNKEKAELKSKRLSKEIEEKNIKLEEQHEFLQNMINSIDQSIIVIDKEMNVLLANNSTRQLFYNKTVSNNEDQNLLMLDMHTMYDSKLIAPIRETFEKRKSVQRVYSHLTPNGKEEFVEFTTTPLYTKDNDLYAVIELGHVITDHLKTQKKLEQQKDKLNYQAHYDSLTNLPNRVLFIDRLKHSMEIAKRENDNVVLMFIDLDHFKEINDSIGHHAGDFILQECAVRLKNLLREVDTVSRFGGDEFTVILEKIPNENDIISIVQQILMKLREPYQYEHRKLYCGASIGISIYPENGETDHELLKNADAAMYKAKENGRNTYSFYTQAMTEKAFQRVILETKLREAIIDDSFIMHYQPLINIETQKIIGCEALVRWVDMDDTLIYPDKFISIVEQTGLIVDIGKFVLEKVFIQASTWNAMNIHFDKIAINISVKQLKDPNFFQLIEKLLGVTGCKPEWIEFEIIESFIIEDIAEAIKILEKIRSIGINISLDDFGTGYSSLSYLKKLPINKLKIDKSFIDDIPFDENDKIITKTIINLAKNMNLEVLAEGVETVEQEKFLLENGCTLAQGYYYSKPLSAKEIEDLV